MKKTLFSLLVCLSFIPPINAKSCDINGVWKHADKEAWLEINTTMKNIVVKNHQKNPSAEGLTVVKHLLKKPQTLNTWQGKIYDASTDSFVEIEIKTNKCEVLTINHNKLELFQLLRVQQGEEQG